jgi:Domain of unknown function (DUF2760)
LDGGTALSRQFLCKLLQENEMSRIGVAFRVFFGALGSAALAQQIEATLAGPVLPKIDAAAKTPPPPAPLPRPQKPARSEAITLLAALQREARLVDLVLQPLGQFSDEQIGAAARTVLADAGAVLRRCFDLQPVTPAEEGASLDVPRGYDPARFQLTGQISGQGPFRGQLVHHGWQATVVKLPDWTGSPEGSLVITPAEVEL